MLEVLSESIRWVNLPFTVLLGVILLYWLLVGIGLLDADIFGDSDAHIDLHSDVDVDAHLDADGDTAHPFVPGDPHPGGEAGGGVNKDLGANAGGNFLMQALAFMNVGQVPVMLVVSVLSLCLWMGSLLLNRYFTGGSALLALAFLIPNFIVGICATRYLTLPFKPLFARLTRDRDESVPIIGQRCRIVTSEATPEFGQAEIATEGAPLLLNVRTLDDSRLAKGDIAVVVRVDDLRSLYFITPLPHPTPTK